MVSRGLRRYVRRRGLRAWSAGSATVITTASVLLAVSGGQAQAASNGSPCGATINPIVCENSKEGDPGSDWEIEGIGDESIQGFATAISVNPGETEQFKIKTNASKYNIRILRLGYYGGDGARVIEPRFKPSATLPQTQPECQHYESTGLIDCGNWSVSASTGLSRRASPTGLTGTM